MQSGARLVGEILPALEAAGVDVGALQLAWDFTTASAEAQTGMLQGMRAEATARFEAAAAASVEPLYKIVRVDEDPQSVVPVTFWGTVSVPAYVSPTHRAGGLRRAALRKDGGSVNLNIGNATAMRQAAADMLRHGPGGEALEVGFVVRVPRCLAPNSTAPAGVTAVVQYGHGLFGDRAELLDGYLGKLADEGGWLTVATDWRGMSRFDLIFVARALLSDPDSIMEAMVDNLMQSFINMDAVMAVMERHWRDFVSPEAQALSAATPPPRVFHGVSQGGVIGAGFSAFSPRVQRASLGVPGAPFTMLLSRSLDFRAYHALLRASLPDARAFRLFMAVAQSAFDALEAPGWLAAAAPPDRWRQRQQQQHWQRAAASVDARRQQRRQLAAAPPDRQRQQQQRQQRQRAATSVDAPRQERRQLAAAPPDRQQQRQRAAASMDAPQQQRRQLAAAPPDRQQQHQIAAALTDAPQQQQLQQRRRHGDAVGGVSRLTAADEPGPDQHTLRDQRAAPDWAETDQLRDPIGLEPRHRALTRPDRLPVKFQQPTSDSISQHRTQIGQAPERPVSARSGRGQHGSWAAAEHWVSSSVPGREYQHATDAEPRQREDSHAQLPKHRRAMPTQRDGIAANERAVPPLAPTARRSAHGPAAAAAAALAYDAATAFQEHPTGGTRRRGLHATGGSMTAAQLPEGAVGGARRRARVPVLMQAGLGDAEVSTVGAEILARTFGAVAVTPLVGEFYNIPAMPAAVKGESQVCSGDAVLALYDYRREAATVPLTDLPPPFNWVHLCVRHDRDAQLQLLHFVATGCVVNFCGGACVRAACRDITTRQRQR